jgi:LPXTG-motif cell wall-anchored protein
MVRKLIAGTVLTGTLALTPAAAAFGQDTRQAQDQESGDDDDNGQLGLIGLAGLLGLAGLAGLKRRDRQPDYGRTTGTSTGATRTT